MYTSMIVTVVKGLQLSLCYATELSIQQEITIDVLSQRPEYYANITSFSTFNINNMTLHKQF